MRERAEEGELVGEVDLVEGRGGGNEGEEGGEGGAGDVVEEVELEVGGEAIHCGWKGAFGGKGGLC